jgi:nucleotide-binding universal stress UspA family protein
MAQRKIVIGYNDSPQGEDALALGRVLCEALDAVAAVAVVTHVPRQAKGSEVDASVEEFYEPLFATARERLGDLKVREAPIVDQSPGRALHELAAELNASVTVIGSAQRGRAGQVVLGGVGESMLSGAPCAIAVAPLGYAKRENGIGRIGVAVDGSAQSWRALQGAAVLAGQAKAPLRVLTVEEPHHYVLGGALSPLSPEEYGRYREGEAEGILDKALERVPSGVSAERGLLHGPAADALAEEAKDLDLLILGSRGYGPVKGALLGSVSAKLMKAAPCAVLVFPRGSGTDPLGE